MNITSQYEKASEAEFYNQKQILQSFTEPSPKKWEELNSEQDSKQKTLFSSFTDKVSHNISFESRHKSFILKKNSKDTLFKAERSKKEEKFKILNFQQKSLIQKKSEFDRSYAKLQKKLIKTLDEKEIEEREVKQIFDSSGYEGHDDCLNFTKKGLWPLNQSLSKITALNLESLDNSPSAWNTSKSRDLFDFNKIDLIMNQKHSFEKKSPLHKDLKYRLIKKLGIDKLFHQREGENNKSQASPTIDSNDQIKRSFDSKQFQPLDYLKTFSESLVQKSNLKKHIIFNDPNESFQKKSENDSSPLKASRSIYKKILRFAENNDYKDL